MAPALPQQTTTSTTPAQGPHRPRSLEEWRTNGFDYALDKGIDLGGVFVAVALAWFFIRFISKRIEHWGTGSTDVSHSAREQRRKTAAKLFRNLGRAVLTVVAVLMVLNQLDFNISPLLASAGVVGLAVSFGSQSLVRDYVTGFFLQLEHQFALGDVIRVGNMEGTVENITLRLVYLREGTGALHIIPNGVINQVTNLSRAWGNVTVDIDVAWRDTDKAIEAITRAVEELGEDPAWKSSLLAKPQVGGIERISGGAVTIRSSARVDPYRRDEVAREIRRRIRAALAGDDISTFAPGYPAPSPAQPQA